MANTIHLIIGNRKKLQPELPSHFVGSDALAPRTHEIASSEIDAQSVAQAEVPPWEDGYEYGSTSLEGIRPLIPFM